MNEINHADLSFALIGGNANLPIWRASEPPDIATVARKGVQIR